MEENNFIKSVVLEVRGQESRTDAIILASKDKPFDIRNVIYRAFKKELAFWRQNELRQVYVKDLYVTINEIDGEDHFTVGFMLSKAIQRQRVGITFTADAFSYTFLRSSVRTDRLEYDQDDPLYQVLTNFKVIEK